MDIKSLVTSKDDATAVADALAASLVAIISKDPTADIFAALKSWQEAVHAATPHFSAKQSRGYRKALLVASHCIFSAEPDHITSLTHLLRTVMSDCNNSHNVSQPGSYMIRLSETTPEIGFDLTQALLPIIGEVVQHMCQLQQVSDSQLQELRTALRLAFNPALEAPQDHLIAQLLCEARPRQLLQAVHAQVQEHFSEGAEQPDAVLLTLPEPLC